MNQIISKHQQMGRFRPKMDATRVSDATVLFYFPFFIFSFLLLHWLQALHTLGFSSGTGLIDISVEEIQNKFSLKMQEVMIIFIHTRYLILISKKGMDSSRLSPPPLSFSTQLSFQGSRIQKGPKKASFQV